MSETADLAREHIRAFNDRDWSVASRIFSPDLTTTEPAAGTIHGIEPFLEHAKGFVTGFPDARIELVAVVDDGERVSTEGVFVGTNTGPLVTPQGELPPTGRALRLPYLDIWTSEAGRITAHSVYYDQMGMAAQLGLLPEPTSA
jgi:steroid delta-isomerase-like uncharacterized protein